MIRCPPMAPQVVVSPYWFQAAWCWLRLESYFSASTFHHNPLLDPLVGYMSLCRTVEAYLRCEVILFVIVLLLFLGFCFISCTRSHGKWKKVSENDEDVAGFFVTPCIMVLSLGDLEVVTISVEMSDSSDMSSPSRVPVEVAKSQRCSTGVDSLANLLFPLPSGPCPSRFSSMAGSGWTSTSNIAFYHSEDF